MSLFLGKGMSRHRAARRAVGPRNARELEAQLLDGLLEAYVTWREACEGVAWAYAQWAAASAERPLAYDLYRTALDAEEQMARGYRHAADHIGRSSRGALD
jgi:hypothetical protein